MNNPFTTLFITTDQLKNIFSTIENNVDDKLLVPNIVLAQKAKIEDKLGLALTEALKAEIEANTLTGNYKVLVEEYIAPTLAYWSWWYAIPKLHMKYTNAGVTLKAGVNSTNASLDEIGWSRKAIMQDAMDFENILINYLEDNIALYPLYSPKINRINTDVYKSGIIIRRNYPYVSKSGKFDCDGNRIR